MYRNFFILLSRQYSFLLLLFFAGCVPYHKIIKSEFPQGKNFVSSQAIVAHALRSLSFYSQFKTLARFDILWLSDFTRAEYVASYARRHGLSRESMNALLRQQLHENDRSLSFYILADVRDTEQKNLGEPDAYWSFYLATSDGFKQKPTSIKAITLEPEIGAFFGQRYTKNKSAYLVRFAGLTAEGLRIDTQVKKIFLYCSSPEQFDHVEWSPQTVNNHTEHEVFYELPLDPLLS